MAALVGPHMYPTGGRDPLPEDEEDEDVLPEPTDFGRLGRPSCDACDTSLGRNLVSAERGQRVEEETGKFCNGTISVKIISKERESSNFDFTSSNQNTVDGSVADRCLTGLDVHERLVADSHEHSLLHADL